MRVALADVFHALGSGQLEYHVAGKLLYPVQLAAANNRRIDKLGAVP